VYCVDELSKQDLEELLSTHRPATLRTAKLKLTARCNLRCYMCKYWKGKEKDRIDPERALSLLDELHALKCRKIHISGGEILIRPDAEQIFARATELGMRVNITTNGTLIDKDKARAIARAGVRSVTISIDSPDEKLHDKIRGHKGAWRLTIKGLNLLNQARKRWNNKLKIRVNTVITRHNWRQLSSLPALLKQGEVDRLLLIPVDEKANRKLGLSKKMIRSYNEEIAPEFAVAALEGGFFESSVEAYPFGTDSAAIELAAEGQYARGYYRDNLCWVPWLHIFVSANGLVYLCCMTRNRMEPLGDVTTERLDDIFRGEAYRAMRQRMAKKRLPTCELCDNFLDENEQIRRIFS